MKFKNMVKNEGAYFTYLVKVLMVKNDENSGNLFSLKNDEIQELIGGKTRKIGELKRKGMELGFWAFEYIGLPKVTHYKVNVKKIYKWLETNNKGL